MSRLLFFLNCIIVAITVNAAQKADFLINASNSNLYADNMYVSEQIRETRQAYSAEKSITDANKLTSATTDCASDSDASSIYASGRFTSFQQNAYVIEIGLLIFIFGLIATIAATSLIPKSNENNEATLS